MPEYKKQHWLPTSYLKFFASDQQRKFINLFLVGPKEPRIQIPLRPQCADDYFYGKDPKLEKAFSKIEKSYSLTVEALCHHELDVHSETIFGLRDFALFLHLRNRAFISTMRNTFEEFEGMVGELPSGYESIDNTKNMKLARMAISIHAKTRHVIRDLSVVIIHNCTSRDFIAADNPAILTNRFLFNREGPEISAHLTSAGLILMLPLTPRYCVLAYDTNVYFVPRKRGAELALYDPIEVDKVNEFQFLTARTGIYFRATDTSSMVREKYDCVRPFRPKSWVKLQRFSKIEDKNDHEVYERYEPNDHENERVIHELISNQILAPIPTRWFSFLKFRSKKRFVDTGTGMGIVRPTVDLKNL